MKRAEVIEFRQIEDDGYLKFTKDHRKIGGGDSAAGMMYAYLEFRAHLNGPGDTEFLDIDMAEALSSMGGWEMNPETARAGIRKNLQTGVFIEGPRAIRNGWRLRINRVKVQQIMGMTHEQATVHFAEIRELRPLPIPPRKESSRYAEIRKVAQAVGFVGQTPEPLRGNPQSTERNSANTYIGSNYSPNTNNKLASSQYAENRKLEPLEQSIADAANGLELEGKELDGHTRRVIAGEISKVSRLVETLEVEALHARCAGYAKSRRQIGWGIVVNDTRAAVTRRMEVLLGGRKVAPETATSYSEDDSREVTIETLEGMIMRLPDDPRCEGWREELKALRRCDRKLSAGG